MSLLSEPASDDVLEITSPTIEDVLRAFPMKPLFFTKSVRADERETAIELLRSYIYYHGPKSLSAADRDLPGAGEIVDCVIPFIGGQLQLARKIVQVADHSPHDLLQAGLSAALEGLKDFIGDGMLVEFSHGLIPRRRTADVGSCFQEYIH